jgi:hypothetical protein
MSDWTKDYKPDEEWMNAGMGTRSDKHMEDVTRIASDEEAINKSLKALGQETELEKLCKTMPILRPDGTSVPGGRYIELDHAANVLAEWIVRASFHESELETIHPDLKEMIIQKAIKELKK